MQRFFSHREDDPDKILEEGSLMVDTIPPFPWSLIDHGEAQAYFDAVTRRRPRCLGSAANGEIQILAVDLTEVRGALLVVRERAFQKHLAAGKAISIAVTLAREETQIGPVFKDRFMQIFRDLCRFPGGFVGTYECQSWGETLAPNSVCVAPITPASRLVLTDAFHHAIRARTLEFVRGGLFPGDEIEMGEDGTLKEFPTRTIAGEVLQETGYRIDPQTVMHLGAVDPLSGLCAQEAHYFAVSAEHEGPPQPEATEAIYGAVELTPSELEQALLQGYYEYPSGSGAYAGTRVRMRGALELAMLQMLRLHDLI